MSAPHVPCHAMLCGAVQHMCHAMPFLVNAASCHAMPCSCMPMFLRPMCLACTPNCSPACCTSLACVCRQSPPPLAMWSNGAPRPGCTTTTRKMPTKMASNVLPAMGGRHDRWGREHQSSPHVDSMAWRGMAWRNSQPLCQAKKDLITLESRSLEQHRMPTPTDIESGGQVGQAAHALPIAAVVLVAQVQHTRNLGRAGVRSMDNVPLLAVNSCSQSSFLSSAG